MSPSVRDADRLGDSARSRRRDRRRPDGLRRDAQFGPVELGASRSGSRACGIAPHLAGELVGRVVDHVDVRARRRSAAGRAGRCPCRNQKRMSGCSAQHRADRASELLLRRRRASILWTKLMTKVALRGSAAAAEHLAAVDEHASAPPASRAACREIASRHARRCRRAASPAAARPRTACGRDRRPAGSRRAAAASTRARRRRSATPTHSVIQRWRTEPRTRRV